MIDTMNSSDMVIVRREKRGVKSAANESRMRRRAAEHEHPAPPEPRADDVVGQRREEEPEVVAGMHVAGAHLPAILRPLLGDERAADRLLAAEPDAAEDAQDGELPDGLRPAACQREDRIHQDGGP